MSYAAVEEQNIEGEHVDIHLNVARFGGFSWTSGQNLERKQLFCGFVDSHDFTIHDKVAEFILFSRYIFENVLDEIRVGFGDVFQISGKYFDAVVEIVHLTSKSVVLVLACWSFSLESA